jgi:hypothetical protein
MTVKTVADPKIRVRTFAKGLLSALAHDLELDLPIAESSIEQLDDATWSGRIVVGVDAIRVVGVLRRGNVATDVLSAGDRAEIEKRLRDACAPAKTLVVTAKGTVDASGKAKAAELHAALENKGKATPRTDVLTLRPRGDEHELHAEGSVSMRALGLPEIKGPLGAFVVKDDVRFEAHLTLR